MRWLWLGLIFGINCSFAVNAQTLEDYKMGSVCITANEWGQELVSYAKHKDFEKGLQILEKLQTNQHIHKVYTDRSQAIQDIKEHCKDRVLFGFAWGLIELNKNKFVTHEIMDTWIKKHLRTKNIFDTVLYTMYGDSGNYGSGIRPEQTPAFMLETGLKNGTLFPKFFKMEDKYLSYLAGYYYATGNPRVIDAMRLVETTAQNCVDDKAIPCPDPLTLYSTEAFLKQYDTDWHNQAAKNSLVEKITLEWKKKEAEEVAKRAAKNERRRAERKKSDEEFKKKYGLDLDSHNQGINAIIYNPKTGETQKLN